MFLINLSKKFVRLRCDDINMRGLSQYVQGQSPEPKIREYFYYVDHQGMLFLDDARMKNFTSCFKERKFLKFFFNQMKPNHTDRYKDFPYLSLCGKERNYVRCDDFPFVYTHIFKLANENGEMEDRIAYNHTGEVLSVPFEPNKIFMLPNTGRVYHPAPGRVGHVGLVRSKLAIEISKHFTFDNGENLPPTRFTWDGKEYELDNEWFNNAIRNKP